MDKRTISYFLPLLLAMLWQATAHSAEGPDSDKVSFRVEAGCEVQNNPGSVICGKQADFANTPAQEVIERQPAFV
ncbi:hypothetical protein MNBD_GAMMA14-1758 [hydrothermal vent metagenome]|uniref:Uncharacterized protein n=1 Tax=hydrothermal vent metagenome TaxID=652676 RepID=A0A3B0ZAB1_9ZZZZ